MIHAFNQIDWKKIVKESNRNDPVRLFGVQLWLHLELKRESVFVEIVYIHVHVTNHI